MKTQRTVLKTRHDKAGYDIRTEEVEIEGCGNHISKTAYTSEGCRIGKPKFAHILCVKMGIKPEMISDKWHTCAVGFCERDQKWYGWSRFMHGFAVGDKVTKESCIYIPSGVNELANAYRGWNDLVEIVDANTIRVSNTQTNIQCDVDTRVCQTAGPDKVCTYEVNTGRGEWTADTRDDARQMACDFAEDGA